LAPEHDSSTAQSGRSGRTCQAESTSELPGTVDLAHSGTDLDLWPDHSDGAI